MPSSSGSGGADAAKRQSLAQLRSALDTLHSYKLPDRYRRTLAEDGDDENADPNVASASSSPAAAAAADDDDDEMKTIPPGTQTLLLSDDLIDRYRSARDSYLCRQIENLLLQHLPTYDPSSSSFAHPPLPTPEEEEEFSRREEEIRLELMRTAQNVEGRYEMVRSKYDALKGRRDELTRMVEEMERGEAKKAASFAIGAADSDADMSDDGENSVNSAASAASAASRGSVDESELSHAESRLENLIHRRNELKAKLREVRGQSCLEEMKIREAEEMLGESRRRAEALGGAAGGVSTEFTDPDHMMDLNIPSGGDDNTKDEEAEALRRKAAEIRSKAAEYRSMAEYYDYMREILEALGGVRILGVEEATTATAGGSAKSSDGNDRSVDSMSMDVGPDDTSASITDLVRQAKAKQGTNDGEELAVRIELAGRHVLRVGLGCPDLFPMSSAGGTLPAMGGGAGGILRAVTARFLTDTNITDATVRDDSDDSDSDVNPDDDAEDDGGIKPRKPPRVAKITLPLPTPTDLLLQSRCLPPDESVRFLVRENLARIRALEARARILAELKVRVMTKVYDQNDGEGGLEQQVVCSLGSLGSLGVGEGSDKDGRANEELGVTASLRLSPDCPLFPSSCRIDQLVGLGGWDDDTLDEIKNKVNGLRLGCPLMTVERLGEELRRVASDRGGKGKGGGSERQLPATPKLPEKRRKRG
mmetsp:Transcript_59840/g.177333  ORF Transcript_59840/g.177333 Transcript_59840/m.177333 type:complete len:705 (-) Transcript_59840:76-2190(-)